MRKANEYKREINIRPYTPCDANELTDIFHHAVHQIGSLDYSEIQVAAWSPEPVAGEKFNQRVSDGRDVWVAVDEDEKPIGFIELERNGHIDCFYCSPEHAGRGVGAALYRRLEAVAIERGIKLLFVEASEAAQRFFMKVGFTTKKRRDFHHNGTQIHNYLMTKRCGS